MAGGGLGHVALVEVGLGGTGCPAQFRIVEMVSRDSAVVTEPFGTCAEAPDAVWFDRGGAMHVRFQDQAGAQVHHRRLAKRLARGLDADLLLQAVGREGGFGPVR